MIKLPRNARLFGEPLVPRKPGLTDEEIRKVNAMIAETNEMVKDMRAIVDRHN